MTKYKLSRNLFLQSLPILLAFVTFFITLLFKQNPTITESIYSQGIYPYIAQLLSLTSFYVPFSISDSFYLLLILFLLSLVLLTIFRKIKFPRLVLIIVQTLSLVYALFYILWGFNYYRLPIAERIGIENRNADKQEFIEVFNRVIERTNTSYIDFSGINLAQNESDIEQSYKELADYLHISYSSHQRKVKYISMSDFFAKATILGYYGPFFSEVHINKNLSEWDIPIVIAHEKAHQFGITSEAEANLYGCLCCLNSYNKYLNYSAWLYILDYFIYESRNIDERKTLLKGIDIKVKNDLLSHHKHWTAWRNAKIDKVTSKVNDAYLKSNSVEKGIEDYNDIVQLMVDLYYSNNSSIFNKASKY